MQELEKKIKGFLGAAAGTTIVMIIVGILFVLFPGFSLSIMQSLLTVTLIAVGILLILRDSVRGNSFSLVSTFMAGVIFVVMGVIIWLYPQLLYIVSIIIGVYMIIASIAKLRLASGLRNVASTAYTWSTISNFIGLICGVIMIVHPGESTEIMIMILGVMLLIYGISGLIDTFVLNARIDDISHTVKKAKKTASKIASEAKEAEIVSKKKSKK